MAADEQVFVLPLLWQGEYSDASSLAPAALVARLMVKMLPG